MSNLNDEDGNEIGQPKLFDMSIYEKAVKKTTIFKPFQMSDDVRKANELYKEYKEYRKKDNPYEEMDYVVYGGIYFCAKQIVEAEEKHKDEIIKLNVLIDKLAEEIRRNSGDCKFCELNNHCPCGNNYDHDFCPTPVLSRYNILKHFMK